MTAGPVWEAGRKSIATRISPSPRISLPKSTGLSILAFYNFARAADDVADDPELSEGEKIPKLDRFEDTLLGRTIIAEALPLRAAIAERGLSPQHGQDLLTAFRMDASKHRYANWGELMHYCTYSAAPVGRFVLDVHGESRATWPANDALCAALQVINHLQDCGADYRRLNRVYIPLDTLAEKARPSNCWRLQKPRRSFWLASASLPQKPGCCLARRNSPRHIKDLRLSLEVAAIERLAKKARANARCAATL